MIRRLGLYIENEKDRWVRHRFDNETRSVIALFERHLEPPCDSGKLVKVNTRIMSHVQRPEPSDAVGVVEVQIEGDHSGFFELAYEEKKQQTLEWLFRGIEIVTKFYGWDIKPYEDAREAVLNLNFENHWTWPKRAWWRNDRRLVAEVFVEHDIEEVRLYIQLRKRSGDVLQRTLVVTDMPHEFVFNRYFGLLRWIDDVAVQLLPKFGEGSWSVKFDHRHFP